MCGAKRILVAGGEISGMTLAAAAQLPGRDFMVFGEVRH